MGCTASSVTEEKKVIVRYPAGVEEVEADFIERAQSFDSMKNAPLPIRRRHACAPIKRTHDAYVQRLDKAMKGIQERPDDLVHQVLQRRKREKLIRTGE